MKRVSFLINIIDSVFVLVLVIVGIVKMTKINTEIDMIKILNCQSDLIWGSVPYKIAIVILIISYLALIVYYIIECEVWQRVLMCVSIGLPIVLTSVWILICGFTKTSQIALGIISLLSYGLHVLNLVINEITRYKFIIFFVTGAWIVFGLYFIAGILLVILGSIIFYVVIYLLSFTSGNPVNIYNEIGERIGYVFENEIKRW